MAENKNIEQAYELAKQKYADLGVDTEKAIENLSKVPAPFGI